jgi:hypothetical protein
MCPLYTVLAGPAEAGQGHLHRGGETASRREFDRKRWRQSMRQRLFHRLLWLDVDKSFVVRQHQGHYTTKTCLSEGWNRAWIDPMFVERIRTDLELHAGPGELSQLVGQIVRSLQAADRRPVDDDS